MGAVGVQAVRYRVWAVVLGTLILGAAILSPAAAQAAPLTPAQLGGRALDWAEAHALGHPYVWGGAGPYGYDCSGVVLAAFGHADGIWLPHNTVAMIASGELVRTWHPRRGDLAFWGPPYAPYHVEFVTAWWHTTFGAQDYGTLVGWHRWNGWWEPSSFWEIR